MTSVARVTAVIPATAVGTGLSKRRGYMLVEALAGSALLVIAVGTLFHVLGHGDRSGSVSARRGVAHAAMWGLVNRYRSTDYSSFPADGTSAQQPLPGVPSETMRSTVTITTLDASNAACRVCKQVDVTIEYRDALQRWKPLRATTYVAQP